MDGGEAERGREGRLTQRVEVEERGGEVDDVEDSAGAIRMVCVCVCGCG